MHRFGWQGAATPHVSCRAIIGRSRSCDCVDICHHQPLCLRDFCPGATNALAFDTPPSRPLPAPLAATLARRRDLSPPPVFQINWFDTKATYQQGKRGTANEVGRPIFFIAVEVKMPPHSRVGRVFSLHQRTRQFYQSIFQHDNLWHGHL